MRSVPAQASSGEKGSLYGVRACISEDGGHHWDTDHEIILREDGLDGDMGYPSSIQIGGKDILTVYYWHEEDPVRYLQGTLWTVD